MKCKECVHYKLCRDLFCQVDTLNDDDKKCDYYEPTRPHGKWIISEVRCPYCLEYFDTDCYDEGTLDKCPNCGADMRKEGEAE